MSELKNTAKFRTEKVAPDGGWGYLIAIGIALPAVNRIFTLKFWNNSLKKNTLTFRLAVWAVLRLLGFYSMIL